MKFKKYILIPIAAIIIALSARTAHAVWVYTTDNIPYCVSASGTCNGITVNAGVDTPLPQPQAGISGITGTASSGAGTITSTSWSYVSCSIKNPDGSQSAPQPSCPRSGMVISGASGTSSPLSATMVNMDGAAVGTRFTYKFSATDSAGNTGSDLMDIYITAPPTPNLIASYDGPASASPGNITLNGTVSNAGGADATNSFTSYFEVCPTASPCGSNTWTSPGITLAAGQSTAAGVISVVRSLNPASTTTYQVRVCADGSNTVNEGSYEGDNCSGWAALTVTVTPPPPPPPTTYTITASSGANGSVTPAGATSVTSGNSQLYTITPNSGYDIASVVVDGASVGAVGTYNFSNVTSNHTISATFSVTPPPPPPTASCGDGIDNDSDGKTDYPNDPGCTSINDNNETDPKPIFIEF